MQIDVLLLILIQVFLLYFLLRISPLIKGQILYKYFNPYGWFCFFYFFWFLVPQIVASFPPHFIIGFNFTSSSEGLEVLRFAQKKILFYFLLPVILSSFIFSVNLNKPLLLIANIRFKRHISGVEILIILIFFMIGVSANIYLGNQLLETEGSRGNLVKSPSGKLAFTLLFFGNFSFSLLCSILIRNKKYFIAGIVSIIFISSILLTAARGRMLWPSLLIYITFLVLKNHINYFKVAILALVFLLVLLMIDPIVMFFKTEDVNKIYNNIALETLYFNFFFKRNFDGFANFATILYYDRIPYDISILWKGARNTFLAEYFPLALENNYGFGATFPGTFWLIGKDVALFLGAFLYGLSLGIFNFMLTKIHNEYLYWTYLTLMPWYCAIAGNFIESLDKMIISIIPPLMVYFFVMILKSKTPIDH